MHVQRPAWRPWQKLVQRSSQHVGADRVPKPSDARPTLVVNLIPRLVFKKVQATHLSSVSTQ
jgi:hypothetical protein